ncbi:efflux RND transporter periplasmic adaptor subunit [Deinococcus sp.]|uniref:efflux RND transporter periplasmic adaptor subunit n=1 Tax=Deinococcus sp. TaxID=47478 RepID=UPI0025EFBAED|nr:efflux RND transporter periplasmic adaptor subunit [Deinococcus sp.]
MRRKTWVLSGSAVLLAAVATGGMVVRSSTKQSSPASQDMPVSTAKVEKGKLSATVSQYGILTYRARPDGSPYTVINRANGTYTELPENGDKVGCGEVLYRVNDHPVLLLCGPVPAYRDLHSGDVGRDVRELNQNLHTLGYDAGIDIDPQDKVFTQKTQKAVEKLQRDKGFDVTGTLALGDAVFLPEAVRIARVAGELGGSAQPGAQVVNATTDTPVAQLDLAAARQREVRMGDRARITLPGNRSVTGKVDRFGRIAQAPEGQNANVGAATLLAYIRLDDPQEARGLDSAPVQVDITTRGVESALSVPVTALFGKSGGGFAVEVVGEAGEREVVAVKLGLFDATAGRVQVGGHLRAGDSVVVPPL